MTWILATIARLPRPVWYILAAISAVAAFMLWLDAREDAAVERDRAQSAAEAHEKAQGAEKAAAGTVEAKRGEVDAGNQRAREAAAKSDDPLAEALRELRK